MVELTAEAFTGVVKDMGEASVTDVPKGLPDEIVEFLPGEARWQRSDRLDQSISRGLYTASFHVDTAHHAVIVDCVNPVLGTGATVAQ
ncbi:hypothetical protein ABZV75_23950 [Streptomyces flaveolus]|uniref:hypothetical protein n=1 Tax=Streptomyces flaveolus TaxID=67297 RepID=UPI00339EA77B